MFFLVWSASLTVVSTFTATAALPYEHLRPATAGLKAELRRPLLAGDVRWSPRWETLTVTEPREFTDLRGRAWYEYRAPLKGQRPFRSTTGTAADQVTLESG